MGSRRLRAITCVGLALTSAVALTALGAPVPVRAAEPAPCSSGLVALTFDDGPDSALTPRFLELLHERDVPATFFVVGRRAASAPSVLRRAAALGFTIGNHTYDHENLVRLTDAEIASTLRRTQRAIRAAGVAPTHLMRPPYGSIDRRVRAQVSGLDLVPVLWTADPRDWDGRSVRAIVSGVLRALRPGEPNVVVLHDGVAHSDRTLAALPRIIRRVRERGYCLAALDRRGRPRPPVPLVRVSDASVGERPGGSHLRFTLTLSRATSRRTSVAVRTVAGTATPGRDFVAQDTRVFFPVGARGAVVRVRVPDDLRDEPVETLRLRLRGARGLRVADGVGVGRVRDDDQPPRLRVGDVDVVEPAEGLVDVAVPLRLARPSGWRVVVTMVTVPGTATEEDYEPVTARVELAPGEVLALLTVQVRADALDEPAETFTVRAESGRHVDLTGAVGQVTVVPPDAGG